MKNIFIITILSLAVSVLLAQEAYNDAVYLKNGNIIWGKIIENIPNMHVKIQTRSGNVFTLTPSEIVKITYGNNPVPIDTTSYITPKIQKERIKTDIYQMPQLNYRFSGNIGIFTTFIEDFNKIYDNKSNLYYGGNLEIYIDFQLFLMSKISFLNIKSKERNISSSFSGDTLKITEAVTNWNENWFLLGAKIYINTNSPINPFIGAGIGYFNVREDFKSKLTIEDTTKSIDFSVTKHKLGLGIYSGFNIQVSENISLFTEIEYTIAKIKDSASEINKTYFSGSNLSKKVRILGNNINIGGISFGGGIQLGF